MLCVTFLSLRYGGRKRSIIGSYQIGIILIINPLILWWLRVNLGQGSLHLGIWQKKCKRFYSWDWVPSSHCTKYNRDIKINCFRDHNLWNLHADELVISMGINYLTMTCLLQELRCTACLLILNAVVWLKFYFIVTSLCFCIILVMNASGWHLGFWLLNAYWYSWSDIVLRESITHMGKFTATWMDTTPSIVQLVQHLLIPIFSLFSLCPHSSQLPHPFPIEWYYFVYSRIRSVEHSPSRKYTDKFSLCSPDVKCGSSIMQWIYFRASG